MLALAAEMARDERFDLAEGFADGPHRAKIGEFCRQVHRSDEWPALLGPLGVDVVVVGRERDEAVGPEPLRRLAQLGIPLILPHPLGGPLLALELDMIRRDSGARLIPHYPGCRHPALVKMKEMLHAAASQLGVVEQLVFERAMPDRRRETVAAQLARDVGLMQSILGPLNKVTAQGPAAEDESWGNLSVHLAGESGVLARWSVEPTAGSVRGRMTLVGSQGRVVLEMPVDVRQWRFDGVSGQRGDGAEAPSATSSRESSPELAQVSSPELSSHESPGESRSLGAYVNGGGEFHRWDEAQGTIQAIVAATNGELTGPEWSAVCRELELVDAVEVSLRRHRTIELHHETVTEEDTFKGLMSAVGCLLVLIVPLVLIGVAILDGLTYQPTTTLQGEPISVAEPSSLRRFWPVLLAAPLIAFLLMQTLRFVFPATTREGSRTRTSNDGDS